MLLLFFLMCTSGMTHSKKTQRETLQAIMIPLPQPPTSNQLPIIIIDVLDQVSSGNVYPAGFLLIFYTSSPVIFPTTLLQSRKLRLREV